MEGEAKHTWTKAVHGGVQALAAQHHGKHLSAAECTCHPAEVPGLYAILLPDGFRQQMMSKHF